MRALLIALAAAILAPAAQAQQSADTTRPAPKLDSRLRTEIAILRGLFGSIRAPEADSFRLGNQEIPSGDTLVGTVAVARGDLAVRGRIGGDAIAVHGDVIVYPGGSVGGNAIAVDGRVRSVGGIVDGDVRSIRGITGSILAHAAGEAATDEPQTTWGALRLVIAWFALLAAIGIGVMLFAEKNLDGVVVALEQNFTRSFWLGVLTQIAAIPVLLLVLLALVVSLIGILLVPFAVVAYVIALAGLCALGFLAVARFTGRGFFRGSPATRAVNLRALFVGLVIYVGLWLLAAAFSWNPMAASMLRGVALAGTWVALTFGLGATLLTRAGTLPNGATAKKPKTVDDLSWQTPTPVTGVVAARRPVVAAKER
jgi:hypothetical protein